MNTYRIYIEMLPDFDIEAQRLKTDIIKFFGKQFSCLAGIQKLRILYRYDISGLPPEQAEKAVKLTFSEPQCNQIFNCDDIPDTDSNTVSFGMEYLPGQYDQKVDSAEQCMELAAGIRPEVRCAKFFVFCSDESISNEAFKALQSFLVNPVDSRLIVDAKAPPAPEALQEKIRKEDMHLKDKPLPEIPVIKGFTKAGKEELASFANNCNLAMPEADLEYCRNYFLQEGRDPTLTELKVLDTYWSDHCRHTTFNTILESIEISPQIDEEYGESVQKALVLYEKARREVYAENELKKDRSLMDIATIGAKLMKKRGLLDDLDESPEVNACTVKIKAKIDHGGNITEEPYLLLFKNETHNHPTEIEPFGGASTCLGGGIRDPLSGRANVHQAMRITGASDPRRPISETLPGKLPQIKIARDAAAGYSSYGNQIGVCAGQVAEIYHPGYAAKRMELGALIGAVPQAQVRRLPPEKGDLILLIGGKTGRDGIGGATGSSKIQSGESAESAGAEVQKGNPAEERKIVRLFWDPEVTPLIKRCNDFGAGGVSVAVGELAPGLDINLDNVPVKYAGLNGTELAISESQERMAVVVSAENAEKLIAKAAEENLQAVVIAKVTCGDAAVTYGEAASTGCDSINKTGKKNTGARLKMTWKGKTIVDLSRVFLDSHGAPRRTSAMIAGAKKPESGFACTGNPESAESKNPQSHLEKIKAELGSLRSCSRRGLAEYFDSTIGASSVLFPWGGKEQAAPECGMAALLPVNTAAYPKNAESSSVPKSLTASIFCYGFDPLLMEENPYKGAKAAVKEALAKFTCLGGDCKKARLSMQEYFEKMESSESWGRTTAALLGALEAQLALEVPAIGGKDSMSGTYKDPANGIDISVPSTLVVFAAGTADAASVRSGTLSGKKGNPIILFYDDGEHDEWELFKANMEGLAKLAGRGLVKAACPVGSGGTGAALALMAFGNMTGIETAVDSLEKVNEKNYPGAILVELDGEAVNKANGEALLGEALEKTVWTGAGRTINEPVFRIAGNTLNNKPDFSALPLSVLRDIFEAPLAGVYPQKPEEIKTKNSDNIYRVLKKKNIRQHSAQTARPLALIPVFPGTNCEWDLERAFAQAGAVTRLLVFRNRSAEDIAESINALASAIGSAQIIALSGGFSAGTEPMGSGSFPANVFRLPAIAAATQDFLKKREGLLLGIDGGYQALVKLGLIPWGEYREATKKSPVLTFNRIGRHVSRMIRTVVMPSVSPWLALDEPGTVHTLPFSCAEGRLAINKTDAESLFKAGQVPFCYSDQNGNPVFTEPDNPAGSDFAIEALASPDGRILGKMTHPERSGKHVHINIPGNKSIRIFEAGVRYFL